jgi:murein DD-endopeptidase MepM/ murein hydrolase activator NlpD
MAPLRIAAAAGAVAAIWTVAAANVPDATRLPLGAIVPGAVVAQPFGCTALALEPFDPFCPTRHVHTGIDLAAALGAQVFAATSGVARVGYDPAGAGLYVAVSYGPRVRLLYCHLRIATVRDGETVAPGQRLGEVGSTGLTTGPHLHFEVQVDGRYVDPVKWLGGAGM